MTLPNLELPIEDRNAAEFWRDEFAYRYIETGDQGYREARDAAESYIEDQWPEDL